VLAGARSQARALKACAWLPPRAHARTHTHARTHAHTQARMQARTRSCVRVPHGRAHGACARAPAHCARTHARTSHTHTHIARTHARTHKPRRAEHFQRPSARPVAAGDVTITGEVTSRCDNRRLSVSLPPLLSLSLLRSSPPSPFLPLLFLLSFSLLISLIPGGCRSYPTRPRRRRRRRRRRHHHHHMPPVPALNAFRQVVRGPGAEKPETVPMR
jgi:hypothetical protein